MRDQGTPIPLTPVNKQVENITFVLRTRDKSKRFIFYSGNNSEPLPAFHQRLKTRSLKNVNNSEQGATQRSQ